MTSRRLFVAWMLLLWALDTPVQAMERADSLSRTRNLWQVAAQEQSELEQRGVVLNDASLSGYLQTVTERLWKQVHTDLNPPTIKIIMDTGMEAYAYPNGYCFLTTGILNQIENEDQLAMIIAHEMVHYIRQHTVELYNYLQTSASENGLHGTHRPHAADGKASAQNIDAAEYQADNEGLSILKRAGYREAEVLTLLSNLLNRMRDHGQSEAVGRIENRIRLIQTLLPPGQRKSSTSLESDGPHAFYLNHIAPALVANAQVALQRGDWDQADCSISKFLVLKPDDARAYFIKGEILRRQNDRQDENQCAGYYEKALNIDPKFPLAYQALGELHFKAGRYQTAKPYFEAFLHLAPQDDAGEYIKGYLRQCRN